MPLRPAPPRPPETYADLLLRKYVLALHCPACGWAASSDDGTEVGARIRWVMQARAKERFAKRRYECPQCGKAAEGEALSPAQARQRSTR